MIWRHRRRHSTDALPCTLCIGSEWTAACFCRQQQLLQRIYHVPVLNTDSRRRHRSCLSRFRRSSFEISPTEFFSLSLFAEWCKPCLRIPGENEAYLRSNCSGCRRTSNHVCDWYIFRGRMKTAHFVSLTTQPERANPPLSKKSWIDDRDHKYKSNVCTNSQQAFSKTRNCTLVSTKTIRWSTSQLSHNIRFWVVAGFRRLR
jgi:predicted Fe-S protein YdhL (DUF1289 family)